MQHLAEIFCFLYNRNMEKKSIILLSGGLDSLVSLGVGIKEYNIQLALTFDYGQKPVAREIATSKKITDYYGISHKVISLPFLKEISHNAFTDGDKDLPTENLGTKESAKAVWIPNRNGLFLNIAASIADAEHYTHILFGANKEEGQTFPDNTQEFVDGINESLKYSTFEGVKVVAPLINCSKDDIVKLALEHKVPLELAYSCYKGEEQNCGVCESCLHLKKALEDNGAYEYIERLF